MKQIQITSVQISPANVTLPGQASITVTTSAGVLGAYDDETVTVDATYTLVDPRSVRFAGGGTTVVVKNAASLQKAMKPLTQPLTLVMDPGGPAMALLVIDVTLTPRAGDALPTTAAGSVRVDAPGGVQ